MAEPVSRGRDWRNRRDHTREVRERVPNDILQSIAMLIERVLAIEELAKAQAEQISRLNLKQVETESDLSRVRSLMVEVGRDAERKLGRTG